LEADGAQFAARTEQEKSCRTQAKGKIKMSTNTIENPEIVSREEWLVARKKVVPILAQSHPTSVQSSQVTNANGPQATAGGSGEKNHEQRFHSARDVAFDLETLPTSRAPAPVCQP
jgi:hypothetical protein